MTKIMHAAIAAAASILLLAGCSSVSAEPVAKIAPAASSAPASPVVVKPSVAPVAPTAGMSPDGEAAFLKAMHADGFLAGVDGVSDTDFLRAGHLACQLFAQGLTDETMDIIQGDDTQALAALHRAPNRNDRDIADAASQTLCPEYDVTK